MLDGSLEALADRRAQFVAAVTSDEAHRLAATGRPWAGYWPTSPPDGP